MISTKKTPQPSVSKRIFSASIVKPIVAASTILLIDRMYFKNTNMRSNLYFAGTVAAGIFVFQYKSIHAIRYTGYKRYFYDPRFEIFFQRANCSTCRKHNEFPNSYLNILLII